MDLEKFDYELPSERIAQEPLPERDASKLLVIDRKTGALQHRTFRDLPEFIGAESTLIRNNATVLPARLHARRPTGGAVECFLVRPEPEPNLWVCLLRPGRKLANGSPFGLDGEFKARVTTALEDGTYRVAFELLKDSTVVDLARRLGSVPLPPYIARQGADTRSAVDAVRYQTVYAAKDKPVAAAAPTAGLHFTERLLTQLETAGTRFAEVTLHVGLGTFKPIQAARIEEHVIHREIYEVPRATASLLLNPQGRRRVAIGTTVVRSTEDFLARWTDTQPPAQDWQAEASLYLYPPCTFRGVDALITNFHQPRSTLLCLVSAFLSPGSESGVDWLREVYAEALRRDYRFLSYGDAMLIL